MTSANQPTPGCRTPHRESARIPQSPACTPGRSGNPDDAAPSLATRTSPRPSPHPPRGCRGRRVGPGAFPSGTHRCRQPGAPPDGRDLSRRLPRSPGILRCLRVRLALTPPDALLTIVQATESVCGGTRGCPLSPMHWDLSTPRSSTPGQLPRCP
jgi:hypothetical protein